MKKKYELHQSSEFVPGNLYRIRATRNFGSVRKGDLGGFVASEENLSHYGNCWVYDDAVVKDSARITGHAKVRHKAIVCGHARICGRARVTDNAMVYGHAFVSGRAVIEDRAQVYDHARVRESAHVHGSARVYEHAVVRDSMDVQFSHCTRDISRPENLTMSIKCQTGLETTDGHVYAYKHVRGDLSSLFDPAFVYSVGEYAEAKEYDPNPRNACSSGLHVSNSHHWEGQGGKKVIMVKVALDDILSVQQGKIRCKRLFVLGVCDSEVF